ncbi:MAG: hypothetical protein CMJ89_00655 [Planctomycetes bacterium]|nr:hypothetical protein [Planctomycetota bacterium]
MNYALITLAASLLSSTALAQDPSFHATQRDNIDIGSSSYGDIWGHGNLALLARFGQNQIDIVNVSNPNNISISSTYTSSNPNSTASDQDIKAGTVPLAPGVPLMFVSLESGGSDGVEIVDISNPSNPQRLTRINAENLAGPTTFVHNTTYRDDGWLVVCDSSNPSIGIIDLRNYDPNSPPSGGQIEDFLYELTGLSNFVHDVTITDDYLFISGWDDMIVYDVSNLGNSAPTFLGEVRGISSHAVWPSDDGVYVVTTEERSAGAMRLYELVDNGGNVNLRPRDSWVSPTSGTGQTFSAHNPVLKGNRVYVSNYSAGVAVLQIDRTTHTWEMVASFDTSTQPGTGFAGCWGVYPGLGEDRVLASDIGEGIYVIDMSALEIVWPSARPLIVSPSVPTSISVQINELGNRVTSSVFLLTSIDGAPFVQTAMTNTGGNTYTGDLPAVACDSRLDYYVSALATNLEGYHSPADAPSSFHSAYAADGLTSVFSDNFQSNLGWTVSNTNNPTAPFARGNPVEDGAQPESGDPDTPGANCYMTGLNGGGVAGNLDLDGGTTRLSSPTLDFSGGDGLISYKRWFFCNDADSAERDELVVAVSNNDGASYTTVETIELKAGGWIENTFRVSDHVNPNASIKVRFTVSDDPNDSITEAGVDTFSASTFDCNPGPVAQANDYNGTGVNPFCYGAVNLPVLGTTWETQVGGFPNLTFVLGYTTDFSLVLAAGELLVDPTSTNIVTDIQTATPFVTSHLLPIPNDVSYLGRVGYFQGGTVTSGVIALCNGVQATVGF